MLVVVVAAASAFTAIPANAELTGVIALAGTGSFSPGLVAVNSQPQTFSFNGSGALTTAQPGTAGVYQCNTGGYDSIGSLTQGAGGFSGSCSTPCGTVAISSSFVREFGEAAVSGTVTSGCLAPSSFAGDCGFTPTNAPSATTYAVVCDINFEALAGAVVIAGTGSFERGLGAGPQFFTFGGEGAGTAGGDNGTLDCTITGNDTVGTTNQGNGDYAGNCTTPCGAVSVSGSYSRVSAEMSMIGNFTSGCLAPSSVAAACLFTPVGALAVTNFALACVFEVT